MKTWLIALLSISQFEYSNGARAEECSKQSHWQAFAYVHSPSKEQVHFYTTPKNCSTEKCSQRRKAYLLDGDFVLLAGFSGEFVCASFRGKSNTIRWLPRRMIDTPRTGPNRRQDLNGSWSQIPCGAGDDCMLELRVSDKKPIEITLMDHLHGHPGGQFSVQNVQESPGVIVVSGSELGSQNTSLKIIYDSSDLPPGMIRISGDDNWYSGLYSRDLQ